MNKESILEDLLRIVRDLTSDFDTDFSGGIGPRTLIVSDLGFESVDVVEMTVAIEEHYKRRDFPFQELVMREGRYHDFTIEDLADFIYKHWKAADGGS